MMNKAYSAVDACIYCQAKASVLTDEHIIAYALGGRIVLPKASCENCQKLTCKIENLITHKYGDNRFVLGIRSRKTGIPKNVIAEIDVGGIKVTEKVSLNDLPAAIVGFQFNWLPGILYGETPTTEFAGKIAIHNLRQPNGQLKGKKVSISKSFTAVQFGQMLAKIAHAYTVAELGLNNFKPLLTDFILSNGPLYPSQYIGGSITKEKPGYNLHDLSIESISSLEEKKYLLVRIHLFAPYDMPVYYVVTGEPLS